VITAERGTETNMTLAEARTLKTGDLVLWKDGDWNITGEFIAIHEMQSFKSMTYNDLFTGNFDFTQGGRKSYQAYIKYVDDDGRIKDTYVNIRKLSKYDKG